jgi:hypothetical protein
MATVATTCGGSKGPADDARAGLDEAAARRPFAPDSVWNARLRPGAPLSPRSSSYVRDLVEQVRRYGASINTDAYSTPVYAVTAGQATVRVRLDIEHPSLQSALNAVPIPPEAHPADGSDRHLVVWQRATDTMWELWQAREEPEGWHASYGGRMRHVSRNPGYFTGRHRRWGATATSLPLLGGLIRLHEVQDRQIKHALAVAIPEPGRGFVPPAQRGDGEDASPAAMPEGTRLRLPARLDIDRPSLSPLGRMIARAAQRYGIIVRDRAGDIAFYGEDPTPSGHDPYAPVSHGAALAGFPWRRLQVLAVPRNEGH